MRSDRDVPMLISAQDGGREAFEHYADIVVQEFTGVLQVRSPARIILVKLLFQVRLVGGVCFGGVSRGPTMP